MKAKYEVADILRRNHHNLKHLVPNRWRWRTLYAIEICRTAALGGHIDQCLNTDCNQIHISYNSCRNRHCPKCQGHKRQQWILARENELINTSYYHMVFTLPSELYKLTFANQKIVYSILFKTAWSVVRDFAANPKFIGGKAGMISILHTWGQNLSFHPHLHCSVPGGGINPNKNGNRLRVKTNTCFLLKPSAKFFGHVLLSKLDCILSFIQRSPNNCFRKSGWCTVNVHFMDLNKSSNILAGILIKLLLVTID